MKVLILSQHYWPETFRITEIAASLRQAGCEVSVLTGQPNYPDGVVFSGYRAASLGRQAHEGTTIYRVPLVPRGRASTFRLVANYLSFLAAASVLGPWLLRRQRFDVIFVYGTSPILQAVAGIVLRATTGAALVTWVQDLWPQSLEVTGYVRSTWLLNVVAAVVRWIYRRSDLLLVQSQAFVASVRAMAGGTPVSYHPQPGELAFDRPPAITPPALVLEPGFNVVFAGNLGTVQSLETLLDAAERLLPHLGIRLVLIGSGNRSAWLAEEVARRRLANVRLPGRFGPEAMPGILAQASVLLVSLIGSPIMSQTIPGKVQAYLAAGRPIIASLDGEGARVVREAEAGLACPAEDAAALADAILRLQATDPAELDRLGRAGRRYYVEQFAPGRLTQRLLAHFVAATERRCARRRLTDNARDGNS